MSISSTASSTLWAHLLRKDKQNEPILATSVPLAPVDKTGTSVRLLLHDTQATLEKFSQRIDKLVKGVEDFHFKAQEKEKEWADEVEQSTKSIIADAVKKSTLSLQESFGQPSQVPQLKELQEMFLDHVNRLHTKIDAIQMINQTQSQALQTLQDQQGQILSAVLPLLPLLQALPLHVDAAKTDLRDAICVIRNMPIVPPSYKRKSPPSSSPASSALKRARMDAGNQLPSPSRSREAEINLSSTVPPAQAPVSRSSMAASAGQHFETPLRQFPSRNHSRLSSVIRTGLSPRKMRITPNRPVHPSAYSIPAPKVPTPNQIHSALLNQVIFSNPTRISMFAQPPVSKNGKRFIPLGDEDDEEEEDY